VARLEIRGNLQSDGVVGASECRRCAKRQLGSNPRASVQNSQADSPRRMEQARSATPKHRPKFERGRSACLEARRDHPGLALIPLLALSIRRFLRCRSEATLSRFIRKLSKLQPDVMLRRAILTRQGGSDAAAEQESGPIRVLRRSAAWCWIQWPIQGRSQATASC